MIKYQPSIITKDLEHCFICGKNNAEVHHVMFGVNRKKSTKYGLTVGLCVEHHRLGKNAPHTNREVDLEFKKFAQRKFEEIYGHEKWMKEFHRNYL